MSVTLPLSASSASRRGGSRRSSRSAIAPPDPAAPSANNSAAVNGYDAYFDCAHVTFRPRAVMLVRE